MNRQRFHQFYTSSHNNYIRLLQCVCALSRLFSESEVPALYYRAAENIFCKTLNADNLARTDGAYDAKIGTLGIGIKTFVSKSGDSSEKIAEFNKLSGQLPSNDLETLAYKLAEFRNDRISLANRLYGITEAVYHCIARTKGELCLFETDYELIEIENISNIQKTKAGISFDDRINKYSFNTSKSTLFRRFITPDNAYRVSINIVEDPYELLLELLETPLETSLEISLETFNGSQESFSRDYVILPLYATRNRHQKKIPEKSGLNQWNAGGRSRDAGEVYISVPRNIHAYCPNFFPTRDINFSLQVPTGEILSAKLCQDGAKALMTNPNNALADWLLRKLLKLSERQLATYQRLEILGFDSVKVTKIEEGFYKIDVADLNSYEEFINQFKTN